MDQHSNLWIPEKEAEGSALTVLFAMGDEKLQHLVHCPHEEDESQLGHSHGNQTPQEDRREDRPTEGNRI